MYRACSSNRAVCKVSTVPIAQCVVRSAQWAQRAVCRVRGWCTVHCAKCAVCAVCKALSIAVYSGVREGGGGWKNFCALKIVPTPPSGGCLRKENCPVIIVAFGIFFYSLTILGIEI